MKLILFVGLMPMFHHSFSQTFSFDRGVGNPHVFETVYTAIELITQNKPEALRPHFSAGFAPDSIILKEECAFASTNFPYVPERYPPCFCSIKDDQPWLERTYYKKTNGKTEYLYQIFITLVRSEDGAEITDIQFRHDEDVIPRDTEMREMNRPVNSSFPPPPPPPPRKSKN